MIRQALGISVLSFAVATGITVTVAPAAAANTYCGTSSHGAIYAGPDTSCAFVLNAAHTPLNKIGSEVDVTNPSTGQTQVISGPSQSRRNDDLDDVCPGGYIVYRNPRTGVVELTCDTRY